MLKNIIIVVCVIFLVIISIFYKDAILMIKSLNSDKDLLVTTINSLESKNNKLLKEIEEIKPNTNFIDNKDDDKIKEIIKEKESLEQQLNKLKGNQKFVLINEFKVNSMDVGEWLLSTNDKELILSKFNKDLSFYEIIPIVDTKLYYNDPNELKQLGLTRKRASIAVTLLRSLNPNNKIYLSTEIIYSNDERGFIIKQYN